MKKISLVLLAVLMAFTFLGASKPSLDGRAEVANYGELPSGLFAKSPGYLPGDTVIVTNPQANISIEVMIFGSFDATEGIAIILSPEAAKELYITKGSNVIVQVTKKSDAYYENTILSKTLENYIPETDVDAESEALLQDPVFAELVKESIEEETFVEPPVEEVIIPMEDILFEEILATEEEIPEEVIAEEDLSKIPQTLPDWSEERPIPDFGFSDEIEDSETSEEFIAEMTRGMEDEPAVETTEEVALVPTEPKPPVFTIIPVPVEEEILEDDSIFEEPEVIFVEEVDEEDILEVEIIPEARNIIPVEDVVEIVVEEVVKPSLNIVEKLESGKYYVQIATYSKVENVEKILSTYGNNYPIVVYQPSGRSDYQVMIGGLNKDEYAIVLERFRKAGYKDAFLRSTF